MGPSADATPDGPAYCHGDAEALTATLANGDVYTFLLPHAAPNGYAATFCDAFNAAALRLHSDPAAPPTANNAPRHGAGRG